MGDRCKVRAERGYNEETRTWDIRAETSGKMPREKWERFKRELDALLERYDLGQTTDSKDSEKPGAP